MRTVERQRADRRAPPVAPTAARALGWLTPKRVVIIGLSLVVIVVGGGASPPTRAIQNAAPPGPPAHLDESTRSHAATPSRPTAEADVLKEQAAQALQAPTVKAGPATNRIRR